MSEHANTKVTPAHLKRPAYLYIRQSSMRQVVENQESTQRQYDLRQRAVALGWPRDRIVTIDDDLGVSAAAQGRQGFAKLVSEVGMGRAGIVMGLEVSRLARNSSDWHRLLEICAVTYTLILDEDGVYDPAHFNDRLLLGLKGTMSEAELHVIRARLMGGMLNKARRGELRLRLPIGLVYDSENQVALDPDQQVQQSVRCLFATFRRVGTIFKTVRAFADQGLQFPRRMHGGPRHGEVIWGPLTRSAVYNTLHNPRYAGAYVYGRRTQRRQDAEGHVTSVFVPQQEWTVLIRAAHEGYIAWEDYEENLRRLTANSRGEKGAFKSPPREGPALLQGLVACGVCGRSMSVRYHYNTAGKCRPEYTCAGPDPQLSAAHCQSIPGQAIDDEVGRLLVEAMSPLSLEVSLEVQQELQQRLEEADKLRRKQVERARYEAELCRRRYMQVDPDNRMVADELEAQWNNKLKDLAAAEEEYQRRRKADRQVLDEETRAEVMALAADFPRLWENAKTPQRERKRMVRLLLQDVTLLRDDGITVHIRFKGGATRTLRLPRPLAAWELRQTKAEVIKQIDELMDEHTFTEIAEVLNRRGAVSGCGKDFDGYRVRRLAKAYGLKSRYDRLRQRGLLSLEEVAQQLGRHKETVKRWRREGQIPCAKLDDMGQYMYETPGCESSTRGGIATA